MALGMGGNFMNNSIADPVRYSRQRLTECVEVGDAEAAKKWERFIETCEDVFYGSYTLLTLRKVHELAVELKGSNPAPGASL